MSPVRPPVRRRATSAVVAAVVASCPAVLTAAPAAATPTFTLARPAETRDRFATAASVARTAFPGGVAEVAVVNGDNPVDALAASAFAGVDLPILYVRRDSVPASTAEALRALAPEDVYVVGGTGAVSDGVVAELHDHGDRQVYRLSGRNRYETAAELALATAEVAGSPPSTVLLARGDDYADALAAAPWAAKDGVPVLLTAPAALPAATVEALELLDPAEVVIVGGAGAVSAGIERQVFDAGFLVRRIRGDDRYETAAAVARDHGAGFDRTRVGLANGVGLVDALPGAVLLAQTGSPVLLTRPAELGAAAGAYLTEHHATLTGGVAIGGSGAIPDAVLVEARQAAVAPAPAVLDVQRTETTVTVTLPALPGADVSYTLHVAPAVFAEGRYVPAGARPPADARVVDGADADPASAEVQVTVPGLTPGTAHELWVSRRVGALPPVVGYYHGRGLVDGRWTSPALRVDPSVRPGVPSVVTVPAAPRILGVVPRADGLAFTVTLEPLPAGLSYTVWWRRPDTDAEGRYASPFTRDTPVVGAAAGQGLYDGEVPVASRTVLGVRPGTAYELFATAAWDYQNVSEPSYFNSATGTSQTVGTPVPAAPSFTTPATP